MIEGEIVYCNLKFTHNRKKYYLKEVIYKYTDGFYDRVRILNKLNIKEKVKVDEVEIIKHMGFENKSLGYTIMKGEKSNERNKITGQYD